ncbi:hypothetical protein RCL1_001882 [Eukaryota sp. TZLM3-RCL]
MSNKHTFKGVLRPPLSSPWPQPNEACFEVIFSVLNNFYSNYCRRRNRTTPLEFDEHLVVGINAVSKAMERRSLSCCIIAKDVKPASIISHIPALAYHSNTCLVPIPSCSLQLGTILGSKSVIAIGFKKGHPHQEIQQICNELGPCRPMFSGQIQSPPMNNVFFNPSFSLPYLQSIQLHPLSDIQNGLLCSHQHLEQALLPTCGVKRHYVEPVIEYQEGRMKKKARIE